MKKGIVILYALLSMFITITGCSRPAVQDGPAVEDSAQTTHAADNTMNADTVTENDTTRNRPDSVRNRRPQ